MNYNFIYYNDSISLSLEEKEQLSKFFPKIDVESIRKLGPSTDEYKFQVFDGSELPKICEEYGCDSNEVTYAEFIIDDLGTKRLYEVNSDICFDSRIECNTYRTMSLNYNCIGWSLGIRDWINPIFSDGTKVYKKDMVDFLSEVSAKYPYNHPKVVFSILESINLEKNFCDVFDGSFIKRNHNIAFYFKDEELSHGSLYIKNLDYMEINKWTSKLGGYILVSHELEDLNDYSKNASYGTVGCMGAVHFSKEFYEEL